MEKEEITLDSIKQSIVGTKKSVSPHFPPENILVSSTILDEIFCPCLQLAQTLLSLNRVGKSAQHANILGYWLFLSLYESLETLQGIPTQTVLSRRQEIVSALVLHASSGNKKEGLLIYFFLLW
jgi:hypothetical protein